MRDKTYFLNPVHEWQRRYEALRASFVQRLPAKVVADRFGYSCGEFIIPEEEGWIYYQIESCVSAGLK